MIPVLKGRFAGAAFRFFSDLDLFLFYVLCSTNYELFICQGTINGRK